jgi:hypothetical protein
MGTIHHSRGHNDQLAKYNSAGGLQSREKILQNFDCIVRCPIVANVSQKVKVGTDGLRSKKIVSRKFNARLKMGGKCFLSTLHCVLVVLHNELKLWIGFGESHADEARRATDLKNALLIS